MHVLLVALPVHRPQLLASVGLGGWRGLVLCVARKCDLLWEWCLVPFYVSGRGGRSWTIAGAPRVTIAWAALAYNRDFAVKESCEGELVQDRCVEW